MNHTETNHDPVREAAIGLLAERGVALSDIAGLVHILQSDYYGKLAIAEIERHIAAVLMKREVQNAILTGVFLDKMAEEGHVPEPLLSMIKKDDRLYGCDEILALSIVNVYGSIGLTNFGHIDKIKPGILQVLNNKKGPKTHTFLDDIVGAIAASASSRIAHRKESADPGFHPEKGESFVPTQIWRGEETGSKGERS